MSLLMPLQLAVETLFFEVQATNLDKNDPAKMKNNSFLPRDLTTQDTKIVTFHGELTALVFSLAVCECIKINANLVFNPFGDHGSLFYFLTLIVNMDPKF